MRARVQVSTGAAFLYPALYFYDSAGWFAALIPAVLIHEAGHALALRCCGSKILSLRLEVTGLCMDCTAIHRRSREIFCAATGPIAGLLWSFLTLWSQNPWLQTSGDISLGLSLFNLLPVMPLDGGRILWALTGSDQIMNLLSYCVPGVLILSGWWLRSTTLFIMASLLIMCRVMP